MSSAEAVFKQGSQTYYYSSTFFSPGKRHDIAKLYAFVRTADDYVDQTPQDEAGFRAFRDAYEDERRDDDIVAGFLDVEAKHGFEKAWTEAFLDAMQSDFAHDDYDDIEELNQYMYGSAEVIGLMITRILNVSSQDHAARHLGRGMQYINFLRDINEDHEMGRQYIPSDILRQHGVPSLDETTARAHEESFRAMMRAELRRGKKWLSDGREGLHSLPWRSRIPVATAADMYEWTADRLLDNPVTVFEGGLKPSTPRILFTGLKRAII